MGKWNNYLELLESKGKDWTDPTYLMQAFSITKKAALQVIESKREQDRLDAEAEKSEFEHRLFVDIGDEE